MDNSKIIANINQLLHNKGIKQEDRFDKLIDLFEKNKMGTQDPAFADILNLISAFDYTDHDLIQELFMLFGSKLTKFKLDQFYTPLTISKFICRMMEPAKSALDPAGGTGDLLLFYNGRKTIWDIDPAALQLCRFNYELNRRTNYAVACKNSLIEGIAGINGEQHQFDYVTMNPPFGSSTTITDTEILSKYELGTGKKKQEIGILFIELGIKLLKPDGILFVIVPAGYVGNGNKQCSELRSLLLRNRVIASIELPKNTFKRSGTGVSTYLLIVQKMQEPMASSYPIFMTSIENIGYNLSKNNTPKKYRIIKETGANVLMDGSPILDNDLDSVTHDRVFHPASDESVLSTGLTNTILDVKRYSKSYTDVIGQLRASGAVKISTLAKIVTNIYKYEPQQKYKYIDIGEISSPLYSSKDLYGWELPSRAKYALQKYDILISKLEGTMSYCVILDDSPNYISTNGVAVLRPNNLDALYILFAAVIKPTFAVQHNAYLTGSIMASLGDKDIGEMLVDVEVDKSKTKKILDTLEELIILRI
jgi:type I restriction-modification system DNA methylase subunit